jgi:very-short-patch-repair endonuclease
MRKNPTPAEHALWRALRAEMPNAAFRRQHPIGPYIADFVCLRKKLIIELDGGGHVEPDQIEYDRIRSQYLKIRGFQTRRYFNTEVLKNLEGVLRDIAEALKQ